MYNGQVSDSILIERFQNGDNGAIDTLVRKHQDRAYQYAYRLTRDSESAADVVAESFVRVYRAAKTFKGQSAFTTWLYRIITNCFFDMRKKAMARQTACIDDVIRTEDGAMEWQFESVDRTPFDEAVRGERERTVQEAVSVLPEYQRTMLVMFHVEMLSYEEIAEVLAVPIGTVKSRLNRARIGLRGALEPAQGLFCADHAYLA